MNYYVYILKNPLKHNEPFYVGKGKGSRAESHNINYEDHNKHKFYTIENIKKNNLSPIVEYYKENLEESVAFELEEFLIKTIGRRDLGTGPLTNLTNGGEGASGYRWPKEKLSERNKLRKELGIYDKIAKSNKGKKRSDETRRKLSESHKGKTQTEESNRKRSKKLKGRSIPEEQRKTLSENRMGENNPMFGKESPMKGRKHTDESRAKIKEARSKQIISEETKKRMSEAQKLRHQARRINTRIKQMNEEFIFYKMVLKTPKGICYISVTPEDKNILEKYLSNAIVSNAIGLDISFSDMYKENIAPEQIAKDCEEITIQENGVIDQIKKLCSIEKD